MADAVRFLALRSGAASSVDERRLANLAPATIERRSCVLVRGGGTGGVNAVSVKILYDPARSAVTTADVLFNPSLPAPFEARNFQPGSVTVAGLQGAGTSFALPADLYAFRFTKLDAAAPAPVLDRCSLVDPQSVVLPGATCTLQIREDVHPVLIPPVESEPWLDDDDAAAMEDLVLGRASVLRSCWDWD